MALPLALRLILTTLQLTMPLTLTNDIETDPGTDTNAAEPEGVDTVDGSSLASWDTAEQSVISRSEVTWPDYSSVPFESYHPIAYNTIPHHILGHHSNPPPHSRPT